MIALLIATAFVTQQAQVDSRRLRLDAAPEVFSISSTGIEIIKLVIAPDGTVAGCDARVVGRGAIVDKENCKKASKLRAKSATDQNGDPLYGMVQFWLFTSTSRVQAMKSVPRSEIADFTLPVSRIPADFNGDSVAYIDLVSAPDGKIEDCHLVRTSGNAALDTAACGTLKANGISPLTDGNGTPVRSVQSVIVAFTANTP